MDSKPTDMKLTDIRESILDLASQYASEPGGILSILCQIQKKYRYIPIEAAFELSKVTDESFADICAIISTFEQFDIEPVGEHVILVCNGTACHAKGSQDIITALETALDVECGHTSKDGKYTLKAVHCVGACSLAPIIQVDGLDKGHVKLVDVSHIIDDIRFKKLEGGQA